jgi:hypothetical protein
MGGGDPPQVPQKVNINMGRGLDFWFDSFDNTFVLMLMDRPREPTAVDNDEDYDYLFHLVRGLKTGEVVGFGNDGGDLAEDYERLMHLLSRKPVPGLYDVPKLGLHDATLGEIVTAIYRRFVLGEGAVEYPTAEEREQTLPTVAEEPTDLDGG